jgi:hypothetical protein
MEQSHGDPDHAHVKHEQLREPDEGAELISDGRRPDCRGARLHSTWGLGNHASIHCEGLGKAT